MFEKFQSANAADFRQRYEGTFGFFRKEDGTKLLTQLMSIGDRQCEFVDARGVNYTLNADSENNKIGFEFIPPKSQYYNTADGKVYLVQRVAQRQFQRGVTSKNTTIYALANKGYLQPYRTGFPALDMIYNKALTPQEAVARLEEGQPFALSHSFALDGKSVVMLYDNAVGSYSTADNRHFKVKLTEPDLWRTEITDAFRALSKTVEVS